MSAISHQQLAVKYVSDISLYVEIPLLLAIVYQLRLVSRSVAFWTNDWTVTIDETVLQ